MRSVAGSAIWPRSFAIRHHVTYSRRLALPRIRPAIELAEAEKTKALLAGVIVAGGLGRAIPQTPPNERKIAGAILACWSLVHGLTLSELQDLKGAL
jgi:hypothetical protein